MPIITVECPKCKNTFAIPDHLAGFIIECSKCQENFYFTPEKSEFKIAKKNGEKNIAKSQKKTTKSLAVVEIPKKKATSDKNDTKKTESSKKIENKIEESQAENVLAHRNEGLFLSVTSIFSSILIGLSLFLPGVIVAKDKYLSFFVSAFDITELGVELSVISPERFLFFLIALIPVLSLICIIVDIRNIVKKRIGVIFYRLLLLAVTVAYFALAIVLMTGGGLNFKNDSFFSEYVSETYELGGISSVFNNVFGPGIWFLIGGVFIIIVVTLFDVKKLLKRKKIEG